MKSVRFALVILLLIGFEAQAGAQYWRCPESDIAMIYQWPHDGSLGGDPCSMPTHFLNYVSDPAYTYLRGPLYNGYLTFALGRPVTDLEVTLTSSIPLNQNWINGSGYTSAGSGLTGSLLASDSHLMLDPFGQGVGYQLLNQFESPTTIHLRVSFEAPIDFIAANLVGYDSSALAGFMVGIDYGHAIIIGDGVEFCVEAFVPEPATLSLLALGCFFLRNRRRNRTATGL